jgi:hypothetical protein
MHTSDLFHKQPWSDGLVNIYDQLGVDYYENKYRWVLGGDGGSDADDGSSGYHDAGLPDLSPEAAKAGGYQTAEQAHSALGNFLGLRGTDQEYANLQAAEAALEAGLPTFVDAAGITQNVRDGVGMPGDYLNDKIGEFNANPSIGLSTLGAIASLTGVGAAPAAAIGVLGKAAGVPDLATVGLEDGQLKVGTPLFDDLKSQVTGKASGGPVVPQGGIGNFYGRR